MAFQIDATETTETAVKVEPQLWTLNIERGEVDDKTLQVVGAPTKIFFSFKVTGDDHLYNDAVRLPIEVSPKEIVDLPEHWNPALHNWATLNRAAILDAVIPNVEPYISMGIAGMPIREAGLVTMGAYFQMLAQPEPEKVADPDEVAVPSAQEQKP